jgi:hypothetical protein
MHVHDSTTPLCENGTDRTLAREWNAIDWEKTRATVNRLQTRIAKATIEERWNLVKRLQYLADALGFGNLNRMDSPQRRQLMTQTKFSFFAIRRPTSGL